MEIAKGFLFVFNIFVFVAIITYTLMSSFSSKFSFELISLCIFVFLLQESLGSMVRTGSRLLQMGSLILWCIQKRQYHSLLFLVQ